MQTIQTLYQKVKEEKKHYCIFAGLGERNTTEMENR